MEYASRVVSALNVYHHLTGIHLPRTDAVPSNILAMADAQYH